MLSRASGHDGPTAALTAPVGGPFRPPHEASGPPHEASGPPPEPSGPHPEPARPRFALPALCVTQVVGWGVLYYAFPVMLPRIVRDTGWSAPGATAAFSAALVVSALAGIPVGRVLDRAGPRVVMSVGSVLGAGALALVATASSVTAFAAGWLLAGLAMAASFYQPAFAALTRWYGRRRMRALTTLTLAGGLASTVFAPVTAALTEHLGWRHATLVLALVLVGTAAPLHASALRGPWPPLPAAPGGDPGADGRATAYGRAPRDIARSRPFVLLATSLTLSGFAMYAVLFGLVPLLTQRGATTTEAAWALGLGGLGQTLGRIVHAPLAARTSPRGRTVGLVAAGGLTTALLAAVAGPVWLLTLVVVAAGTVRGNLTLLQATAVTDRWGTRSYGRLSATLAAPVTLAGALAPWAGAALTAPLGGLTSLFWALAAVSALAAVTAGLGPVLPRRRPVGVRST